jgi:predicted nuclease of predicted toxin-antitoxin system
LGLREAKDFVIFHAAREAGAVVMSKDSGLSCSWSDLVRRRRCCG